jgi:nicotinamidase-related amidase
MHKTNAAISQLVIVDMQVKLAAAMPADALQIAVNNCGILAQAASILNIPTVLTEQYPQGLGETLAEIKQYLPHVKPVAKTAFSGCGEPKFNQQLQRENSHIILVGMESHICVLQTALDLLQLTTSGDNKPAKKVFVVQDAVLSRNPEHKRNAIERMRAVGCIITNTESVLFEWLGNANHPAFKTLSALIK